MPQTWQDRTEIKSESSGRIYVVSQQVIDGIPTGYWACTCPQGKLANKKGKPCKHLVAMGLPMIPPHTAQTVTDPDANRAGFSDAAYRHYNLRDGFGSAWEWMAAAEALAAGRGRYKAPPRRSHNTWFTQDDDLRLLGLNAMPATAKDLVKAMRKMAMKLHPDFGGDAKAFDAMHQAYERLVKRY